MKNEAASRQFSKLSLGGLNEEFSKEVALVHHFAPRQVVEVADPEDVPQTPDQEGYERNPLHLLGHNARRQHCRLEREGLLVLGYVVLRMADRPEPEVDRVARD